MLDFVYTKAAGAYRAKPLFILIPTYKPHVRCSKPALKQTKTFPPGTISALQDSFETCLGNYQNSKVCTHSPQSSTDRPSFLDAMNHSSSSIWKKAQQRLYCLQRLRRPRPTILTAFYNREHPKQLHHSLAWELKSLNPQEPTEERLRLKVSIKFNFNTIAKKKKSWIFCFQEQWNYPESTERTLYYWLHWDLAQGEIKV